MSETELGVMEIVPSSLRYARERVSLSRDELAKRMNSYIRGYRGISVMPETVEAWESGVRGMTSIETWAATEVCMFPFYALFEKEPPPEPFTDFRSPPNAERQKIDYKTHRQLHRFERFYEMVADLSSRLGESEETILPTARLDEPELEVAKRLRKSLRVDRATQSAWPTEQYALTEWQDRAAALGVYVFSLPLNVQQVRGVSRWDDGAPPAILISTSDLASARVFTLMHELVHLMHRRNESPICDPSQSPIREDESRMNRVAAEVLVPERWVREETVDHGYSMIFKEWPSHERARLKTTFGVSSQMLGIRLKELGIVRDHGYRTSAWGRGAPFSSKSADKKPRPKEFERYRRYLGYRATRLLTRGLEQQSISLGEIVKHYIDTKTETVEKIVAV